MQNMLPILEQHTASSSQLDDEDARRLARWAEVATWNAASVPVRHGKTRRSHGETRQRLGI